MNPETPTKLQMTRRHFFGRVNASIGTAALASLLDRDLSSALGRDSATEAAGRADLPHFAPRAKRVIYLFQSGGPSQLDLFDYKPKLDDQLGTELPGSVRMGQRLTTMTSGQTSFPIVPPAFQFARHGECGAWVSELLPHTAKIVDELCFIRSMHTEAINHDPAITFFQTGAQLSGRPSIGSWLSYGLGSTNKDLPAFIVMISRGTFPGQPLYDRLWGSGFLPTQHQGVKGFGPWEIRFFTSRIRLGSGLPRGDGSSMIWLGSTS